MFFTKCYVAVDMQVYMAMSFVLRLCLIKRIKRWFSLLTENKLNLVWYEPLSQSVLF